MSIYPPDMPQSRPSALRFCVAAWAAAAVVRPFGAAAAQSLEVAPVTVEFAPGQAASSLTLVNHADAASTIQLRPFAWDQADGDDRLAVTKSLLVSPPFTTLGPGESQIVRVVLRQRTAAGETAYRLLIDELPPPAAPGAVRVAIRVSLPLFAEAGLRASPQLRARVQLAPDGGASLVLDNDGARRIRLSELRVVRSSDGAVVKLTSSPFAYVLAHSERRLGLAWPSGGAAGGACRVNAKSDSGDVALDAPVGA